MKNKKLLLTGLIASSLLVLTACKEDKQTTTSQKPVAETHDSASNSEKANNTEENIALVNGQPISKTDLQNALNKRAAEGKAATPNEVLQELVNLEILRQEAVKQGLQKDPLVKAEIKRQTTAVLANELIRSQFKDLKLTEDQLQNEYKEQIAKIPDMEYKARHILLKTEDEAKEVIKQLQQGADFAALAKEKSTGPSGKNGGDLGWFQPQTMVPEFAKAVKTMEKGQFSQQPVKTQFGYHIIKLEDTRTIPAPSFDSVKEKIKAIVINKMLKSYLGEISKGAKIEIVQTGKKAPQNKDKKQEQN